MLLKGAACSAAPLCGRVLSSTLLAASKAPAAPSWAARHARHIVTAAAQAQGASASSAAMSPAAAAAAGELPEALRGLQPEGLWRHFATLSSIPRPSKHEGRCGGVAGSRGEGAGWADGGWWVLPAAAGRLAARPPSWPPAAPGASCRVIEWLKSFAEERGLEWQQVGGSAGWAGWVRSVEGG